jgi:hypothetical protein
MFSDFQPQNINLFTGHEFSAYFDAGSSFQGFPNTDIDGGNHVGILPSAVFTYSAALFDAAPFDSQCNSHLDNSSSNKTRIMPYAVHSSVFDAALFDTQGHSHLDNSSSIYGRLPLGYLPFFDAAPGDLSGISVTALPCSEFENGQKFGPKLFFWVCNGQSIRGKLTLGLTRWPAT